MSACTRPGPRISNQLCSKTGAAFTICDTSRLKILRIHIPHDTALVSREGLTGPALAHQQEKLESLKRLSRMLPDARILISFRPHSSDVNTLYSQYLRYGNTLTLPDFFDAESDQGPLQKDDNSFRPYIEAIQAYWGQLPFVFLLPEIMQ